MGMGMRPIICKRLAGAFALLLILGTGAPSRAGGTLPRDAVWFQSNFEGTNALHGWSGKAELAPAATNGHSVAISSRSFGGGMSITRELPVAEVLGCEVRGSGRVRAEAVSPKHNSWNGIKCMLIIETPGGKNYPQAPLDVGTFDWQLARFMVRIPADATKITLLLGLEEVTGKVWFDDLKFTVARPPSVPPAPVAGPMYKGHTLPRLRGTMISSSITPESLRVLGGEWHANLIRWQLTRPGRAGESYTEAAYDRWLESELKKLDAALPICEELGIYVVLDLHSPPGGKPTAGGYVGSDAGLFTDPNCQERFVNIWTNLATRYKSAKPIWGYDLVNEPVADDVAESCADWQDLAGRTAKAVRSVDPLRTIIIEPAHWGGPDGLKDLLPIPVSNVVYSVHMYLPHAFTHQNVFGKTPSYVYPGDIQGKHWDKVELERALQPVVDFQNRYNVHIYIGEFSAIRWAPDNSGARYLGDLIDIFEQHNWDWTYHAFREWTGWSVEHGSDPQDTKPAASPTERQKLLCGWFAKNQKPRW